MKSHRMMVALILALLTASAAEAQTALKLAPYRPSASASDIAPLPVKAEPGTARPAPDLADPVDALAPTRIQANPMASAVFARTAIDHRFSRREDVTGSLGFLCGLQPGHTEGGGAAAFGQDPHGRFVGAKLSFAFR